MPPLYQSQSPLYQSQPAPADPVQATAEYDARNGSVASTAAPERYVAFGPDPAQMARHQGGYDPGPVRWHSGPEQLPPAGVPMDPNKLYINPSVRLSPDQAAGRFLVYDHAHHGLVTDHTVVPGESVGPNAAAPLWNDAGPYQSQSMPHPDQHDAYRQTDHGHYSDSQASDYWSTS
ncbi:hypothetical protein [Rhodoligotrophos defluvii]|uniref:hypothetical protein n=1 Tax=Rhodoligotrophos defluvii TaxID=2561934 RepID=UPI0010C9C59B|nr:hypothetical protein [Rhodoligotrophos defluvii]